MGRDELEILRGGIVKRKQRRRMGLFIDATGLDRATRRLERKVDLSRLVKGLTSGIKIECARYYSLIPYEDDARQFAFLDAVERAGVEVITKRLPPKGVKRQVSMDVHIAADLVSFAYGNFAKKAEEEEKPAEDLLVANSRSLGATSVNGGTDHGTNGAVAIAGAKPKEKDIKRVATIICPSRELSYAIFMANQLSVETSLADFGLYGQSDGWKGVDRWIDLSTSETIWRD